MAKTTAHLPKSYHAAIEKWRDTFIPDYQFLLDSWVKHFPKEPELELCAYRELGMCDTIECGDHEGKPKFTRAQDMHPKQAQQLFGAIRAQASTEFGSIQQHRLTLARAQEEEEQVWILRMMADELRHGYQMLHLLVEDDWTHVSNQKTADMVEEILSMQTGSHVLGAFNIDFDSFVDNVVFCALIDRVGKYQLSMQRISAYRPMAESMPQMLREEAFHLAAGVVPMRRWVTRAAEGQIYVTMDVLQKAIQKWLPRGLEMFGDERGGGTNVRMGFKPMTNAEAQDQYYEEVRKVVRDLNMRYVRAKLPKLGRTAADKLLDELEKEGGKAKGVSSEEILRLPPKEFFRRRGVPAFTLIGVDGEEYPDVASYLHHLRRALPEAYLANRDFRDYAELLARVHAGEIEADAAAKQMPELRRVAGSCPCSKAVRWVVERPTNGGGTAAEAAGGATT